MRICFDLDGTLCQTEGEDYDGAQPIPYRVERVNRLHELGHHIIIATARGQSQVFAERQRILRNTRRQLVSWGVKFHELHPKVFAHKYVDDRAVHDAEFFDG